MIGKLENYVNRAIPYVWDDSESWYEFLAKVITKVNELVDMSNDYFDKDVSEYVEQILNAWYDSGKLADIVESALGDAVVRLDAQLEQTMLNAADYCPLIDSTTDTYDGTRLQEFFNKESKAYYLPAGTYLIDYPLYINRKNNCTFYMDGQIKLKDGSDVTIVVGIVDSNNCTFYGLSIDGNRENVVDWGIAGEQPNLAIGSGLEGLKFYGTSLINAINCGIVFNGKSNGFTFDGLYFENIGEHCLYISGGENVGCTFKNVKVDGYGQNSNVVNANHDCCFVKLRTTYGGINKKIKFENLTINHRDSPYPDTKRMFGFILGSIDGIEINKIDYLDSIKNGSSSLLLLAQGTNPTIDFIKNISVDKAICKTSFIYNNTNTNIIEGFNVYNSIFGLDSTKHITETMLTLVNNFVNCTFINERIQSTNLLQNLPENHKTIFDNCIFKHEYESGSILLLHLDYIDRPIIFKDSTFTVDVPFIIPVLIHVGNTRVDSNAYVVFDNTKVIEKNEKATNHIGVYKNIPIYIKNNSKFEIMRDYAGGSVEAFVTIENSTVKGSLKTNFPNIRLNNVKGYTSEVRGSVTVPAGYTVTNGWIDIGIPSDYPLKPFEVKVAPASSGDVPFRYWVRTNDNKMMVYISEIQAETVTFEYECLIGRS